MFCTNCGKEAAEGAAFCTNCGAPLAPQEYTYSAPAPEVLSSGCSRTVALILVLIVGGLGIHRFYVGKIGTGILWLFTAGMFGIGTLVDLIKICTGTFTDSAGYPLLNWN